MAWIYSVPPGVCFRGDIEPSVPGYLVPGIKIQCRLFLEAFVEIRCV